MPQGGIVVEQINDQNLAICSASHGIAIYKTIFPIHLPGNIKHYFQSNNIIRTDSANRPTNLK